MKILFVSHDASRTGAPIVFLHLLGWLKENTKIDFDILLLKGGELKGAFGKIGKVYVWDEDNRTSKIKRIKGLFFGAKKKSALLKRFKKNNYDLLYLNTVATSRIVQDLLFLKAPIIQHVHELSIAIKQFCGEKLFSVTIPHIAQFIVVSEAVRNNLIKEYSIPLQKMELVNEFIPEGQIQKKTLSKGFDLIKELGLHQEAFIVGGCGTMDWRKGIDLFIQAAHKLKGHPIYFVWIGGSHGNIEHEKLKYDIKKMGIEKQVFLLGSKDNPFSYFQSFDVFFLSSREDPFPLVAIENSMMGKPVICFEGAGGMPELVSKGGGVVVPYSDLDAVGHAIFEFYHSESLKEEKGTLAKKYAQECSVEKSARSILKIISKYGHTQ